MTINNVLLMLSSKVKPHPTKEEIPFHVKECQDSGATYVITTKVLSEITSGKGKLDFPMTSGQSIVAFYGDANLGNVLLAQGVFVAYFRLDSPDGKNIFRNHGLYTVKNIPKEPKGFIEVRDLSQASPGTRIDTLSGIIASTGQPNGLVLTLDNLPDGAARLKVHYRCRT